MSHLSIGIGHIYMETSKLGLCDYACSGHKATRWGLFFTENIQMSKRLTYLSSLGDEKLYVSTS